MSDSKDLTPKQERLLLALLSEPTHEAAAAKAGMSPATLRRTLQLPAFRQAYRVARRRLVEVAVGKLQQTTGEAVEALRQALTCDHPGTRVRAALGILDQSFKALDSMDLAADLEELREEI